LLDPGDVSVDARRARARVRKLAKSKRTGLSAYRRREARLFCSSVLRVKKATGAGGAIFCFYANSRVI
jgi:hypothetical protein